MHAPIRKLGSSYLKKGKMTKLISVIKVSGHQGLQHFTHVTILSDDLIKFHWTTCFKCITHKHITYHKYFIIHDIISCMVCFYQKMDVILLPSKTVTTVPANKR